ncbi:MAG: hypothetical protein JWM21_913 [Acidobacteria bacterium]|nr:hypothetical protein [Acidobacteriota bacterium]
MVLAPKPRFQMMIWSQLVGAVMIISGVLPYWVGVGGATVSRNISLRIIAAAVIDGLMFLIPLITSQKKQIIAGMANDEIHDTNPVADSPKAVQRLIWWYCVWNLFVLTYLVHVTGGLTGSMYSGLYLLIPTLALFVILDSTDLRRVIKLIVLAVIGIFLCFCMNYFDRVEFNAADVARKATTPHAFEIALLCVSAEGVLLLFVQVVVLKIQFQKVEKAEKAEIEKAGLQTATSNVT